jgi:hypothetical protein
MYRVCRVEISGVNSKIYADPVRLTPTIHNVLPKRGALATWLTL